MAPRLLLKTLPSSQPSLFLDVGDTRYTRLMCGTRPPAKLIVIIRVIAPLTSWSRFAHIGGHVWRDITSSPPTHLCPPPRTFTLQKTDWHIPPPHIHILLDSDTERIIRQKKFYGLNIRFEREQLSCLTPCILAASSKRFQQSFKKQ